MYIMDHELLYKIPENQIFFWNQFIEFVKGWQIFTIAKNPFLIATCIFFSATL